MTISQRTINWIPFIPLSPYYALPWFYINQNQQSTLQAAHQCVRANLQLCPINVAALRILPLFPGHPRPLWSRIYQKREDIPIWHFITDQISEGNQTQTKINNLCVNHSNLHLVFLKHIIFGLYNPNKILPFQNMNNKPAWMLMI